jgi:membrane associated rhomboid family serine protease
MGIYDREYYRREGPSFLEAFALRGQVCNWLIILNIAAYVIQLFTRVPARLPADWDGAPLYWEPGPFTEALVLNVDAVLHGQVWRLLTYAFLHDPGVGLNPGGFYWHIIFNMLFLYWFGRDVEEMYGPREFLAFYLVAAVLGGVAFVAAGAVTGSQYCLGASGAVTAVMVLCALHFPHRTILLFFVLPIPLWVFVGFQVAQDSLLFLQQTAAPPGAPHLKSTVAVTVHLGGAAFALLYYKMQWRLTRLWAGALTWKAQRSRPRLRVYREEEARPARPVAASAPPSGGGDVDEQLEAKLDAVLEKVARSGQASLSESERAILLRASEIYKRRRT